MLQTHPLHLVSPESTFYLLLNDLPKAQIQSCLPWWGLTPAELSTCDLAWRPAPAHASWRVIVSDPCSSPEHVVFTCASVSLPQTIPSLRASSLLSLPKTHVSPSEQHPSQLSGVSSGSVCNSPPPPFNTLGSNDAAHGSSSKTVSPLGTGLAFFTVTSQYQKPSPWYTLEAAEACRMERERKRHLQPPGRPGPQPSILPWAASAHFA